MFNLNKPPFGTPPNNTGSFFTSTPTRFGESFSKSNTPNFSEFNKTFGNSPTVFGQTSNPFGQTTVQPFGSNIFGQKSSPQSNELFGGTALFNQPEQKNAFNFQPKSPGVFGQNVSSPQHQNIFQQTSGFSNTFNQVNMGTFIKFEPVKLTDTAIIKGVSQTINGKNQCITCMKEYENKSIEELRWEDYQMNRKGPQENPVTSGNLFFNKTANTNLFGTEPMSMEASSSSTNLFPQENKNLFGFNQKFGVTPQTPTGLFGKTEFGSNQSTYPFGNAQNTVTNPFATTNNFQPQQQLFNQQQSTFGQTQNQTTLANPFRITTNTYNNPVTTINNLTNLQQTHTQQPATLYQGLNNTNTTFTFGNNPVVTSTPTICQSGQSTNQNSLFNSSLIKPNTNAPQLNNINLFNTKPFSSTFPTHATNPLFQNNNVTKYNSLMPTTNLFNYQHGQQHLSPQTTQYNLTPVNEINEQILSMSSSPYGLSDLLNNIKEIDNNIKDSSKATNPNELKTLLKTIKPNIIKPNHKLQPIQIFRKIDQSMFDGLEFKDETLLIKHHNPKKLVLPKYSFVGNEEIFSMSENFDTLDENVEEIEHIINTPTTSTHVEDDVATTVLQINEAEKNCNEDIEAQPHPTGIILTRPEYYTVPLLEELLDYISEDGSCIVQGFTVGRLGYGNVYFPEAFDVSNLNLDELVHFCYKEITIYPDDSKKPPQGQGLNRKAQVTLDKVWPYDKKTNALITDINVLTEIDYANRLRRLCERQQSKFVDYRPDTGSWVFRVEHFSKYGDRDEDIEEIDYFIGDDSAIEETDQLNEEFSNILINDFSKCNIMKSTFFDDCLESIHLTETTAIDKQLLSQDNSIVPTDVDKKSLDNTTVSLDIFGEDSYYDQTDQFIEKEFYIPYFVPLNKSFLNYYTIYSDVAAFKGRSFKVGWSKNLLFTILEFPNNIEKNSIIIKHIRTVTDTTNLHDCLEKHLNCQLNNSQYTIINNIPQFSSIPGFQLLENQENVCCGRNNFEQNIWRLCSALWGDIPNNDPYDERTLRKNLLTSWLQNVIQKDTVIYKYNETIYDRILKCLSLYRIEEAANIAFENNDINISILISQLPSKILLRSYVIKQLHIWKDISEFMDSDILKLYLFVSGLANVELGSKNISIYENMTWLQTFAIYLWYIIEPADKISNGINLYEHAFINNIHIIKPFLNYENQNDEMYDLRFQLLKYYSDIYYPINNLLNPLSYTANTLDYRFSWLLLQILKSLNHSDINPKTYLFININFAAQLEQMQLWHWAIFILLFIEEPNLKLNLIQDIISRNVKLDNSIEYIKKEKFLIYTLNIPSKWIEASKAILAKTQGRYCEAISYFSYAGNWHEAYDILMDMLLPNVFLTYDYELLIKILTPFSDHKKILPNWEKEGGLILDFARLGIEYNQSFMEDKISKSQSIRFRSTVINIYSRFRDINDLSNISHLCLVNASGPHISLLDHLLN